MLATESEKIHVSHMMSEIYLDDFDVNVFRILVGFKRVFHVNVKTHGVSVSSRVQLAKYNTSDSLISRGENFRA